MFSKKEEQNTVNKQSSTERTELSADALGKVTGGGAFDKVPRVPENPLDKETRDRA